MREVPDRKERRGWTGGGRKKLRNKNSCGTARESDMISRGRELRREGFRAL